LERHGWFRILLGLIVLLAGIGWLGNEMKWWNVNIPFWPVVVIIIGAAIFLGGIERKILG
jgi:hypothetical protein